ncbi:uncharacterized protein LOC107013551 [Solanum pennellii]|uniref:Uncharacterized protein LOC107013551 n=1 Tax=Solanum pennellii TaxID=28526 RepID=A0ABM1GBX7_SOLPN|nr:uncharacterized protein LOC107013551 [Solanum pennellii]
MEDAPYPSGLAVKKPSWGVEEEKLRDKEEYQNKKAKTGKECVQQKGGSSRPQFQKPKRHAPSFASAPAPKNRGCYKCGKEVHFMIECPKNKQGGGNPGNIAQSSLVSPLDKAAPRGATSGTGEEANRLYAFNSRQEKEESLDIVTGMI